MWIILKKGVDCGPLGYLPPETQIQMPADSAALVARWVDRGYARPMSLSIDPEDTEPSFYEVDVSEIVNAGPYTVTSSGDVVAVDPDEDAADD